MPKCGCANDQCSCFIVAGPGASVNGGGSQGNPYVVSLAQTTGEGEEPAPVTAARPVGEIVMYAGATAPDATWMLCTGTAISRLVYADLFAAIGTAYGAGDGTTTFNLPNFTARFPQGVSSSPNQRGATGGVAAPVLTTAQMPAHTHSINHDHGDTASAGAHDHSLDRSTNTGSSNANIPQGTSANTAGSGRGAIDDDGAHVHDVPAYTGNSGSAGGTTALENRPPYVTVNFMIRVLAEE